VAGVKVEQTTNGGKLDKAVGRRPTLEDVVI